MAATEISMELIYSTQSSGFDPDKRYRNPEHFHRPEAGVTGVVVVGEWPSVVDAYRAFGVEVITKDVGRVPIVGGGDHGELQGLIDKLHAESGEIILLVDGLDSGEIHRPESGGLALRLFDALSTIHTSVGELTAERDGLLATVDSLRGEVEALKAVADQSARDASEVEALKAKLDEAKVGYRANASKESLEKLVAELPKA